MTKIAITYLSIFLTPVLTAAQDNSAQNDSTSSSKHNFSLEIGVHRSLITGKRYMAPRGPCFDCSDISPPWGSTRFPSTGFQINLLYDYSFYKNFSLKSGLSVFSRPSKREIDSAEIAAAPDNWFTLNPLINPEVLKYDNREMSIEIPIYLGYKYKNFSLFFGIKKPIITYSVSKRTKIDGTTYKVYSLRQYIISFNDTYFDIKLYYLFKNSFHDFALYIGSDSNGIDFWDYNYLQIGLNIPLLGKK